MSAPQKMKMERLSPIAEVDVLKKPSVLCSTPTKPVPSIKKDVYSIEMTSSPEMGEKPKASPILSKPRRRWRECNGKRPKLKMASKNSTPLSHFISRSTFQPQQNFAPCSYPNAQLLVFPDNNLYPIEEARSVDETPTIDNFSPPKSFVTSNPFMGDVKSHLGFLTRKQTNSDSKFTPLSCIVRESVSHNKSLTDSVDVDSEEENAEKGANDLRASIETFPSPEQQSKQSLSSSSLEIFSAPQLSKSVRNKLDSSIVCSKKVDSSSVKMYEVKRKNSKRLLDFGLHPMKSVTLVPESKEMLLKDSGRASSITLPQDDKLLISNDDSVIEGIPKSLREIDDDGLCGFTQCSKSSPDWDSQIKRSQKEHQDTMIEVKSKITNSEIIYNASLDGPPCVFRLPIEMISDDENSSDQSNDLIQDEADDEKRKIVLHPGAIDDHETHPLNFDVTKKSIQSIHSPEQNIYSEAVNIEAVLSPDSHDIANAIDCREETVETTTTTQENEIEESEDVRPRKRFKRGTLVEHTAGVISRIKASQKLFEYEVKANLCPSSKKSQVSTQLVVCRKWVDDALTAVHVCKPLKRLNACEYTDTVRPLIVCILANEASFYIPVGAVVVVHFPVTVIISSRIPYILAGSKLVQHSGHPQEPVFEDHTLDSLIELPKIDFTNQLMPVKDVSTEITCSLRVFQACSLKSVVDAAFCQALVDEILLKLEIVHVVSARDTKQRPISAFCVDEDRQPCLIEFRNDRDVKRAKALEMLHILDGGVHVEAKHFVVMGQETMSDKMKSIFSYSFGGLTRSDVFYILTPGESDWVIVSSGGMRIDRKRTTNFSDVSVGENCGKRHIVEIVDVQSLSDDLLVKDSHGCSLKLCCQDEKFKNRCQTLIPPFMLDGVLFLNKELHSDEYSTLKMVKNNG